MLHGSVRHGEVPWELFRGRNPCLTDPCNIGNVTFKMELGKSSCSYPAPPARLAAATYAYDTYELVRIIPTYAA
jgi:hypothetical protein